MMHWALKPTGRSRMLQSAATGVLFLVAAAMLGHPAPGRSQTPNQAQAGAPQPTEQAIAAGRALFRSGATRAGGDLIGQISRGVELTGPTAACIKCHGSDGSGSKEGGLIAPSLRWDALMRPRPATGGGFGRPAYSEASLLQAIRHGTDSSGRSLSAAMPRFMLGPREAADLMAYLRVLGTEQDDRAGVHADRVVFGAALPLSGPQAARGQSVRQAIQACLERAGREGLVFGRRVELEVIDSASEEAGQQLTALRRRSLALLAPWWPDERLPEAIKPVLAGQEDWPIIAPLWPQPFGSGRWPAVYELHGQSIDQARVVVDTVASRLQGKGLVVLLAGSQPRQQAALKAALGQTELHKGLRWVSASERAPVKGSPDAVIVLGGLDLLSALPQYAGPVYALSTEVGRAAFQWPAAQRQRLWLAHAGPMGKEFDPSRLMSDLKAAGGALVEPGLQAQAWAGSCLAVEALRRAGRQPEAPGLRRALESIARFETGVLPPISFSPRQRHGVWGARMVIIDERGQGYEEVMPWKTPAEES